VSRERRWLPLAGALAFLTIAWIGLRPLQATWHANLGCVLQARGDLLESLNEEQQAVLRRRAVKQYRRAIRIAPHNRTAQQQMGLILMDERHFQDAVLHLEKAWQADPDNTTTHKALGLAYVWVGELEKAKPLLQNVPDIVEELNVWGWWRGTQQQTQLAINAYRMSLMLEPDQPRLQETLAQLED
jgi:tetratricopeptide (TPR) repeat protein